MPRMRCSSAMEFAKGGGGVAASEGESCSSSAVGSGQPFKAGDTVWRFWGGKSGPFGVSWTNTDPESVADVRGGFGLPDVNTGRFISQGILKDVSGCSWRPALELDGNPGGLSEIVIPNAEAKVTLTRVMGVNPAF